MAVLLICNFSLLLCSQIKSAKPPDAQTEIQNTLSELYLTAIGKYRHHVGLAGTLVGVDVEVGVKITVSVAVGVNVGAMGVGVAVKSEINVKVAVGVTLAVSVAVEVGIGVDVGVGRSLMMFSTHSSEVTDFCSSSK